MADKAKNFFSSAKGSTFPAILALGGMAGGAYYLYRQKQKASDKANQEIKNQLKSKLKIKTASPEDSGNKSAEPPTGNGTKK